MKINLDPKKGVAKIAGIGKDLGQNALTNVQQGAKALADKTKDDAYQRRLKKFNPVFPDVYQSEEFHVPNIIAIVDDAERRGIDVCEGAIGWLDKVNGVEIMYLYDEAVGLSGLTFIPVAKCDAVYCVDNFDREKYIQADIVFKRAQDEKIAELEDIACCLGAKRCSVKITESTEDSQEEKRAAEVKEDIPVKGVNISVSEGAEQEMSQSHKRHQKGWISTTFEGNAILTRPKLKWFAHDEGILRLIEMRFSGNPVTSRHLELSGASVATMSQKAAYAVDGAVNSLAGKAGTKGKKTMESRAKKELHSELIYIVEF
ncbi:MAG: hypothetical protein IIX64_03770 [Bacteroidales bacterium]|nr:hypothetical protein [Bacteroidales bacterium]